MRKTPGKQLVLWNSFNKREVRTGAKQTFFSSPSNKGKICSKFFEEQSLGQQDSSGVWRYPHINLSHLNRPSTRDLGGHSVKVGRREMSSKMTFTQTQDSFLRGSTQGTMAVFSPNPCSQEEIGSHNCKQVAPLSLSLRNERKHNHNYIS